MFIVKRNKKEEKIDNSLFEQLQRDVERGKYKNRKYVPVAVFEIDDLDSDPKPKKRKTFIWDKLTALCLALFR